MRPVRNSSNLENVLTELIVVHFSPNYISIQNLDYWFLLYLWFLGRSPVYRSKENMHTRVEIHLFVYLFFILETWGMIQRGGVTLYSWFSLPSTSIRLHSILPWHRLYILNPNWRGRSGQGTICQGQQNTCLLLNTYWMSGSDDPVLTRSLLGYILILQIRKFKLTEVKRRISGHLEASARLVAVHFRKQSAVPQKGKHKSYCVCAQSCPTLCNPLDCSLQGSSVHGIFQARILEQVAIFLLQGQS